MVGAAIIELLISIRFWFFKNRGWCSRRLSKNRKYENEQMEKYMMMDPTTATVKSDIHWRIIESRGSKDEVEGR
jgi:hypothetical protein